MQSSLHLWEIIVAQAHGRLQSHHHCISPLFIKAEPTSPASETVIIIRTGGAGDTVAIDPTSATTTSTTSASFADNGGFSLDDALTHEDPSDTGNHLEAAQVHRPA